MWLVAVFLKKYVNAGLLSSEHIHPGFEEQMTSYLVTAAIAADMIQLPFQSSGFNFITNVAQSLGIPMEVIKEAGVHEIIGPLTIYLIKMGWAWSGPE